MSEDINDLAREIGKRSNVPEKELRLRVGVVTAVDRNTNRYSVSVASTIIPMIAGQSHVYAQVGDVVDVLLDGPSPRVIGVVGAHTGLPNMNTFCLAYTSNPQGVAANTVTRLGGMVASEGNATLWDATNQWYTVPSTGLYLMRAAMRLQDAPAASLNIALSIYPNDSVADESMTIWDHAPAAGSTRRKHVLNVLMQRRTAGEQIRLVTYSEAAINIYHRYLSIIKLGS